MKYTLLLDKNSFFLFIVFLIAIGVSCGSLSNSYHKEIKEYRKEYKSDFNKEEHAPLKGKQLRDMRFFPADSSYQIQTKVSYIENAQPTLFKTSSGEDREYLPYIFVDFPLQGKENRLIVYKSIRLRNIEAYQNYLFLPFNDLTNGVETYGGGRYLDLSVEDIKNNQLIVDFNKAYNPYCAYKAGYSCPIPPAENQLEVAIKAGEKEYAGEYIYGNNQ